MKKTIVAMLVSGTILFPGLSQAQTLEQSVAQSLATHPKIKEAFISIRHDCISMMEPRAAITPPLICVVASVTRRLTVPRPVPQVPIHRRSMTP